MEKARNIFTFYCYFIIIKSSVKNKFGKEVGMTTTQDLVAKVGVEPTTFRLWAWQATTALLGDKEGLSPENFSIYDL